MPAQAAIFSSSQSTDDTRGTEVWPEYGVNAGASALLVVRGFDEKRVRGRQRTHLIWDQGKPGAAPGHATNFIYDL